jgi:hypothetical protein
MWLAERQADAEDLAREAGRVQIAESFSRQGREIFLGRPILSIPADRRRREAGQAHSAAPDHFLFFDRELDRRAFGRTGQCEQAENG